MEMEQEEENGGDRGQDGVGGYLKVTYLGQTL